MLDPARIVLSGADLEGRPDFLRFVEQHNETCLLLSPDPGMDNQTMQFHDAVRVAYAVSRRGPCGSRFS